MPRVVQFRRGTTAQVDAYTGAEGELVVDLEAKTLRIHDGLVIGGHPMLSKSENDDLLAQMATFATDAGNLTTITTDLGNDVTVIDGRVTTLETTEFWKAAADGYYPALSSVYTKAETDNNITNSVNALSATVSANHYLKTDVYTKTEIASEISNALSTFASSADLTQYRLITDSYSIADLDTKFTDINLTYYTRTDSDGIFRRLDDSKSASEVDAEFANLRGETYDRTYIDGTYRTIADSLSQQETLDLIDENSYKGGRVSVVDETTTQTPMSGLTLEENDTTIFVRFIGTTVGQVNILNNTSDGVVTSEIISTEDDGSIEISFQPEV